MLDALNTTFPAQDPNLPKKPHSVKLQLENPTSAADHQATQCPLESPLVTMRHYQDAMFLQNQPKVLSVILQY